jgi:hypothetical protein
LLSKCREHARRGGFPAARVERVTAGIDPAHRRVSDAGTTVPASTPPAAPAVPGRADPERVAYVRLGLVAPSEVGERECQVEVDLGGPGFRASACRYCSTASALRPWRA